MRINIASIFHANLSCCAIHNFDELLCVYFGIPGVLSQVEAFQVYLYYSMLTYKQMSLS
jgi:hypothetical protein